MPRTLHKQAPPSPRAGGALVAALIVVTLVAGMGAGLVQFYTSINRCHAMGADDERERILQLSHIDSDGIPQTYYGSHTGVLTPKVDPRVRPNSSL